MSQFSYKKSAKINAQELFWSWVVGFVFFAVIAIYILYTEDRTTPKLFAKFILFGLIPFSFGMLGGAYYMSKADRDWNISVSDNKLIWNAPTNLGIFTEKSFELNLSDIEKIVSKQNWRNDEEYYYDYSIVLKDNFKIDLSLNSGVPTMELIEVLKERGIQYEHINVNT